MTSGEESLMQLRKELKVLLFFLARESENPGQDLHRILEEVLGELHGVVAENAIDPKLKLVINR